MNKLGSYITKLMTTVLDKEQEEFDAIASILEESSTWSEVK